MGKVGRDDRDSPTALHEDLSGSDRDVFPWYFPGNTAGDVKLHGNSVRKDRSGLTESLVDGAPVFEESRMTLVCRKLFAQPMEEAAFLDQKTVDSWYPDKDFHTLYIAEIEKVLVK